MILPSSIFSTESLWTIQISKIFGNEYSIMFDDMVRMILIQFTIQLMFYMSCEDRAFFTEEFFLLLLYIILGILLYWLVFRKTVKFV
jgi:hypothetical protein